MDGSTPHPSRRSSVCSLAVVLVLSLAQAPAGAAAEPKADRELDVGAGWLIAESDKLSDTAYAEQVGVLLSHDPVRRAVEQRRRLYRDLYLTPRDDRSRVVFLRGEPSDKADVECGFVFKPLEIWRYGEDQPRLIFFRDDDGLYRLWWPSDGKAVLYSDEMRYYMQQWVELRGRISGRRFDKRTCEAWKLVDEASGVDGLVEPMKDRPTDDDIKAMVGAPTDPHQWAESVTPVAGDGEELAGVGLRMYFPDLRRQRMKTLFIVDIPEEAGVEPTVEPEDVEEALEPETTGDGAVEATEAGEAVEDSDAVAPGSVIEPELRVVVEGVLEQEGKVFERFRLRFRHPVGKIDDRLGDAQDGLKLSFHEPLRPGSEFVARMRVIDPTSGRKAYLEEAFQVPRLPVKPPIEEGLQIADVATAEQLAAATLASTNTAAGHQLYLVPPSQEVVFGVLHAEAVVVGPVDKVRFLVDGKEQFSRRTAPFTANLKLSDVPREQIIRVEAVDADGNVLASDEIVINQPRGVFSVRLVEPTATSIVPGARNKVRAEVTLPPERRLEKLEFSLDSQVFATLTAPPFETEFTAPPEGVIAFLAVTATLSTGARVEDVLFLNSPQLLEEVDVQLVELLTTVIDGSGRPVTGVAAEDFEIYDNKRLQKLQKFEVVDNLPLLLGFALDTSSSMKNALPEAKRAVLGFLDNTARPQDRVYVIAFSTTAEVLTPPTDDFDLARRSLNDLVSYGGTALHDAVVTSLFFARGFDGRKVLVLLSDGEDFNSRIDFDTAMTYAQASGTVIYTVGLKIDDGKFRRQLEKLAKETGGRAFSIKKAEELESVYEQIAAELRSQVLLAYAPNPPGEPGSFHEVEVKVKRSGLKARTSGGYTN